MIESAIFESNGMRTEHVIPGTYSRSKTISSPNGVSSGNLAILGKSTGGKPFELYEFASLADAKATLVGDELLNAVAYAFNGNATYTPQKVYAMRVNNGTPSSITLNNGGADDGTPILKLNSWDYGYHTNQLKIWLATGTNLGTVKLTMAYKDDISTVDNIGRESITIAYAGSGKTPTCTIDENSLSLTAQPSGEGPDPIDVFKFSFDDYETLESLVNRINDTKVYTATVVDNRVNVPSRELDTVSSIDITESHVFTSNLYALIEALTKNYYIGSVELATPSSRQMPDTMTGFEYFVGGTAGEYTFSEWTTALTALEAEDVQIIATPSTDFKVHSAIASHCKMMNSTVNKKERTCFLGGAIGEEEEDALKHAKSFNSQYVSYITDNALAINPINGRTETLSGAFIGVMLAGMESAMAINMPLTNKTVNVLSFTKKRLTPNIEKLLKGGILVCNYSPDEPNLPVVVRALTTYQREDLILNERSMVREDLYMNRELRKALMPNIGQPYTGSGSTAVNVLQDLARKWALNGMIIPKGGENVWNISYRVDGDKHYLDFSRFLTAPINFQFITVTNHVYKTGVSF